MARVKTAKIPQLKVQETKIAGERVYGVTDGKNWFFYAYKTEEEARTALTWFETRMKYEVNICHDKAYKVGSCKPTVN